jgi:hypothetical protein
LDLAWLPQKKQPNLIILTFSNPLVHKVNREDTVGVALSRIPKQQTCQTPSPPCGFTAGVVNTTATVFSSAGHSVKFQFTKSILYPFPMCLRRALRSVRIAIRRPQKRYVQHCRHRAAVNPQLEAAYVDGAITEVGGKLGWPYVKVHVHDGGFGHGQPLRAGLYQAV